MRFQNESRIGWSFSNLLFFLFLFFARFYLSFLSATSWRLLWQKKNERKGNEEKKRRLLRFLWAFPCVPALCRWLCSEIKWPTTNFGWNRKAEGNLNKNRISFPANTNVEEEKKICQKNEIACLADISSSKCWFVGAWKGYLPLWKRQLAPTVEEEEWDRWQLPKR